MKHWDKAQAMPVLSMAVANTHLASCQQVRHPQG